MTNNTASAATTNAMAITTTLQPFDVLSGRDKQSFNHIGNRRFRVVIGMNLQRYLDAKTRYERSEMILSFVRELRGDANMRFIKRRGSKYIELNEKQSREKVGHALRDAAAQARGQENPAEQKTPPVKQTISKSKSKSEISKRKQQQKRKKQNKDKKQQRFSQSFEPLPLTFSSPLPSLEASPSSMMRMSFNPSSAFVNEYDEEEFSLSDESLDSLLSLVDEEEMECRHWQEEPNRTEELLDLDTPIPIQLDNNGTKSMMTMTNDDDFTHVDQNELAEFLISQHPNMVSIEL